MKMYSQFRQYEQYSHLLTQAETNHMNGNYALARECFNELCNQSPELYLKVFVMYNHAAFLQGTIGEGTEARAIYYELVSILKKNKYLESYEFNQDLEYNCYKNLIRIALSFDEYTQLEQNIEELKPDHHQYDIAPRMKEDYNSGMPWIDILARNALCYYNFDEPNQDRGAYGDALSSFGLILDNRKMLRTTMDKWGSAVSQYSILSIALAEKAAAISRQESINLEQAGFILQKALFYVQECIDGAGPNEYLLSAHMQLTECINGRHSSSKRGTSRPAGCLAILFSIIAVVLGVLLTII